MSNLDRISVNKAYEDVRNDGSSTAWAFLRYNDNNIVLDSTGSDYSELLHKFTNDDRAFAFARMMVGDELSKRAKFVMITWIGENVSPLKRAKVSTDKSCVTNVMRSFALEIQTSDKSELRENEVKTAIVKAGGANYGTGVRD